MIVEIRKTKHWGRLLVLRCDQCGICFERRYVAATLKKQYHFCSIACVNDSKKTGEILQKSFEVKFGVSNNFSRDSIKEKCKKTLHKNYGVLNPSQSKVLREKAKKTWVDTYGVDNPMKSSVIQEVSRQTTLSKYGVENISQLDETKQKVKRTSKLRHGYEYSFQNSEVRKRAVQSIHEKFGVDYAFQSSEIRQKIVQSMIDNKNVYVSNEENRFLTRLYTLFGNENVDHQVKVDKWPIDYYIKHIDVYVQFDGVYWHGLDRPIELIAEGRTARDISIYKKYLIDKEQSKWFHEHDLCLIRIASDIAFSLSNDELAQLIQRKSPSVNNDTDNSGSGSLLLQ